DSTELRDALAEPRPSAEQIRLALLGLARSGDVERDPPLSAGERRGVKHRWRLGSSVPTKTRYVGTLPLSVGEAAPTDGRRPPTNSHVQALSGKGTPDEMLRAARDAGIAR